MAEKQEFKVLFRRRWPQYIGAISGSLSIFVNLISLSSPFVSREFISIRIVSIVTYIKKKNLGDISLTIPLDSGEEFQFWNIGRLEFLKILDKSSRVSQNFFFFFLIINGSSKLSRVFRIFRLYIYIHIYSNISSISYINSKFSIRIIPIIIWNKFRSVHGWIFTGLRYRMERAMR